MITETDKTKIYQHFIKPLNDFYGQDKYGHGFAQRLWDFAELSPEHLEMAAKNIIERPKGSFPTLAECQVFLKRFISQKPTSGGGMITAENYDKLSAEYCKSRGRYVSLTKSDPLELATWRAYFKQIGKKYYVKHIDKINEGQHGGITVPTRLPNEFDHNAPDSIMIIPEEKQMNRADPEHVARVMDELKAEIARKTLKSFGQRNAA